MSVLIIGSVAFDAIETPFGKTGKIVGGSASYIALAIAIQYQDLGLVAVVGEDFDMKFLEDLTKPSLADTIDDSEIAEALKAKDYERALQTLLERVETVKTAEERNAARELMVQIFQELGQEHPLASTYRKKLAAAIF